MATTWRHDGAFLSLDCHRCAPCPRFCINAWGSCKMARLRGSLATGVRPPEVPVLPVSAPDAHPFLRSIAYPPRPAAPAPWLTSWLGPVEAPELNLSSRFSDLSLTLTSAYPSILSATPAPWLASRLRPVETPPELTRRPTAYRVRGCPAVSEWNVRDLASPYCVTCEKGGGARAHPARATCWSRHSQKHRLR